MHKFSGGAVADKLNANFEQLASAADVTGDGTFIAVDQAPGRPTVIKLLLNQLLPRLPKPKAASGDVSFWGRVLSTEYAAGSVAGWNIEECNADGTTISSPREGLVVEGNHWAGLRWPHVISDGSNGLILRCWPVDLSADPPTYRIDQMHPTGIAATVTTLASSPELPFKARLQADSGTGGYASAEFDCWPPHPWVDSTSGTWYPTYAVNQDIWICGAGDVYGGSPESSVWRDMTPRIPLTYFDGNWGFESQFLPGT